MFSIPRRRRNGRSLPQPDGHPVKIAVADKLGAEQTRHVLGCLVVRQRTSDTRQRRARCIGGVEKGNGMLVYDRLVPGAKRKLDKVNPRLPAGYRKNKHHQHATEDYGLPELKAHLIKVMAYMDAAANDTQFMRMLNRGTPKFGETYEMPLDDVYN